VIRLPTPQTGNLKLHSVSVQDLPYRHLPLKCYAGTELVRSILGTWPLQLSVGRSFGIPHFCLFGRRSCSAQFSLRDIGPTYILSSLVKCSARAEWGQATHSVCMFHLQPLTGQCSIRHQYQGRPRLKSQNHSIVSLELQISTRVHGRLCMVRRVHKCQAACADPAAPDLCKWHASRLSIHA
jgi:hypothetical protein